MQIDDYDEIKQIKFQVDLIVFFLILKIVKFIIIINGN